MVLTAVTLALGGLRQGENTNRSNLDVKLTSLKSPPAVHGSTRLESQVLRRQKHPDLCEVTGSLVYIESTRPAQVT